jgi:hypothetical protein
MKYTRRRRRTKGAELIEFTLNFLPFLAMIIVTVDSAWAVYAEASLQQAVRMAVRQGVTLTALQVGSGNLTDTVKATVQQNAMGFLNGSQGLGYIKVNYFNGEDPSDDVSGESWGNNPGNIMQVSVQRFPVAPLMARIFVGQPVDGSPMSISVYAADIIEPVSTAMRPPIGPAP